MRYVVAQFSGLTSERENFLNEIAYRELVYKKVVVVRRLDFKVLRIILHTILL